MAMKTKLLVVACVLINHANIAMAAEVGSEIYDKKDGARVFGKIAIETDSKTVNIYAVSKKFNHHPQNFSEALRASTQTVDRKLWTITLDQLPVTDKDCWKLAGQTCGKGEADCYQHCIQYPAEFVAFDEKNQKVYLKYPTPTIGVTGEGPALLFFGDINKREMKLLGRAEWLQKGVVSPSGLYLVLYGSSVISVYDTQTNNRFDIKKSVNNYSSQPEIRHSLDLKKWINDTQLTYVDVSRHFTCDGCERPFISAKEITYDISTKSKLDEKVLNEKEYEQIIKDIRKLQ